MLSSNWSRQRSKAFSNISGLAAQAFALSHSLTQIVTSPTRVPDRDGDTGYLLDLFPTTMPDVSRKVSSPLGSSDNCVLSVKCSQILSTPSTPFHRTVWQYSKADWCGFRSFIRDIADNILSESVHKSAHELSEWLLTGMETCIPYRTYQVKTCLLYTSPSPRDLSTSRMPSSA